jgi:hypothetical protein
LKGLHILCTFIHGRHSGYFIVYHDRISILSRISVGRIIDHVFQKCFMRSHFIPPHPTSAIYRRYKTHRLLRPSSFFPYYTLHHHFPQNHGNKDNVLPFLLPSNFKNTRSKIHDWGSWPKSLLLSLFLQKPGGGGVSGPRSFLLKPELAGA